MAPCLLRALCAACFFAIFVRQSFAGPEETNAVPQARNNARMNCGAEIECIMPNGEAARVALRGRAEPGAVVLIGEDDTVSYRLPEGNTHFLISLPQRSQLDRMT